MKNWGRSLGLALLMLLLVILGTAGVMALTHVNIFIQTAVLIVVVVGFFTAIFRLFLFNDR